MKHIQISTRLPILHTYFLLFWALSLLIFFEPLRTLFTLSLRDDRYTHTILIPAISLGVFWLDRRIIFPQARFSPRVGIPLLALGAMLYCALRTLWLPGPEIRLTLEVSAIVVIWVGGFVLCYGARSLQLSMFPLAFLLLTIPLPSAFVHASEIGLQRASAETAHIIFKMIGIPVYRQGLVFSLPGIDIEVAEQCSGIRSTAALLVTVALAGHFLLRSNWSKLCVILLTLPIAIFKNAVRIVTLSWLGVYVSRGYLHGNLHKYGGLPFTLLALALLLPLLLGLRRMESILMRGSNSEVAAPERVSNPAV
jgi:exosortase